MAEIIKAIETFYNGYRFRSRLEARWAVFFDAVGIPYEYEPEGFNIDGIYYLPDFYLPWFKMYVDIKPLSVDADELMDTRNKLAMLQGMFRETGETISTAVFRGDPVDCKLLVCTYCKILVCRGSELENEFEYNGKWFDGSFAEGCWYTSDIKNGNKEHGDYGYSKHFITINLKPEGAYWESFVYRVTFPEECCLEDESRLAYSRSNLMEYRIKARQARFEHGERPEEGLIQNGYQRSQGNLKSYPVSQL